MTASLIAACSFHCNVIIRRRCQDLEALRPSLLSSSDPAPPPRVAARARRLVSFHPCVSIAGTNWVRVDAHTCSSSTGLMTRTPWLQQRFQAGSMSPGAAVCPAPSPTRPHQPEPPSAAASHREKRWNRVCIQTRPGAENTSASFHTYFLSLKTTTC